MNDRNFDGIEEVEKHLYGQKKGLPPPHRAKLTPKSYGVPPAWQEKIERAGKKARLPASFFKKFFLAAVIFFVLALGVSLFIFYSGGSVVSPENIEISVAGTSFVVGGEKLPLLVEIKNENRQDLVLADLVVLYPKGALSTDLARLREAIGTVPANSSVSRVLEPVLLGEEGATIEMKVRLEYRLENSNAIFVKETTHPVVLSSSPILVSFEGPATTTAEQDFVYNLKITSNTTALLPNLGLLLRYPSGFVFSESSPAASFANNFFELGDLAPGGTKTIEIRGRLTGGEGEARTFAAEIGEIDKTIGGRLATVFAAKLQTITLAAPFVAARILVSGVYAPVYTALSQTDIPVVVSWANNTNTIVSNLEIRAKLSGLFDEATIETSDGFYDSASDTIVFNQSTNSDLAAAAPGTQGTLSFSLRSRSFSALGALPSEPKITIEVSIKGDEPGFGGATELSNFERREIKLATELSLLTKALHFSGPIKNSGSIPPKAELETTYTIVWTVMSSANPVTKARISAVLPPYVRFVGNPLPASEPVTFSEGTREVSWRPTQIGRGAGTIALPKEVAFQVAFRPTLSQVGTAPDIIGETTLAGEDSFTKLNLTVRRRGVNTNLTDDAGFPAGGGVVVQ